MQKLTHVPLAIAILLVCLYYGLEIIPISNANLDLLTPQHCFFNTVLLFVVYGNPAFLAANLPNPIKVIIFFADW